MDNIKSNDICLNMSKSKKMNKIFCYAAILAGAIYLEYKNFFIYRTAVEFICIINAFTMAAISYSTRDINKDNRLIFLGIAYGFIGFISFFQAIYTHAYSITGNFVHGIDSISTQLWIITRCMEGLSLLIALKFSDKRLCLKRVFYAYLGTSVLLFLAIFNSDIFPICYLKKFVFQFLEAISSYIIFGILLLGIHYWMKNNHKSSNKNTTLLLLSLVASVISVIFFINNSAIYSLSNIIGHLFRLISYYFVYKALVESSLREPHLAQIELNKTLSQKNQSLEELIEQLNQEYEKRKEMEELQKQAEIKHALLEKAKEMDEIKSLFFCTVSHELKTPVNIILASIQLLTNAYKDEASYPRHELFHKNMKMMKQNCNRLIKLVNNLVDITKIDSGFMQLNLKNHNIVSVIENITLSVAEYIERKGILLVFDTDIEEKVMACDAIRLERVMLNLLSNAVKFSEPKGKVEVNIKDNRDVIVISVKDNGIGIPANMVETVFDRFKQVDSTLRREKEGIGIGLCIVKSIVELHGGKIKLNSEIGKGSEFAIELPVRLISDDFKGYNKVSAARQPNIERINIEFSDI